MNEQQKSEAYQELIKKVKESYSTEFDGLKWCEDCEEINLWTYWQGRGNLNAKIMLAGQDWGCAFDEDGKSFIKSITKDSLSKKDNCYYTDDNKSITDNNLAKLFLEIGYDIHFNNKDLFFTNFVLGYRLKGTSGKFKQSWARHDAAFFKELVEIIEPEIMLCLGKSTFDGVMKAFNHKVRINGYNKYIESDENPIELRLSTGKSVYAAALAHCGAMGTMNRNRGHENKTALEPQIEDWKRIICKLNK
jgi:uracil-DNA glycosylase